MLKLFKMSIPLLLVFGLSNALAKNYDIPATNETTTLGLFDLKKPPVIKVKSGDIVSLGTWNSCLHEMVFNKTTPADVAKFYVAHDIQKRRGMHTLTGPVYVEGAEPGDILEIRILDIELNDFGYNFLSPTAGILTEFTKPRIQYFKYDKKHNTTEFAKGICLQLRPFPGVLGVAPPHDWPAGWPVNLDTQDGQPVSGEFNSVPPGPFGGNLDEPELQKGSILFLPVFHPGGLVWTGDSHAKQNNGEIDVTALETSYKAITLQFFVRKDLKAVGVNDKSKRQGDDVFVWPITETYNEWIITGLNTDLMQAMVLASKNAINFLVRTQGFSPSESYQFLSMVSDFKIAEAVNGVKNVTVHIPKKMFTKTGHKNSLCQNGHFPFGPSPKFIDNPVCAAQTGLIIE